MDWAELEKAVVSENVSFLEQKLAECQSNGDYSYIIKSEENKGNILHLAAGKNCKKFFEVALQLIPPKVVQNLLIHREQNYKNQVFNPLHVAAFNGHLEILKLILKFYNDKIHEKDLLSRANKPWLAKDQNGRTPLHVALEERKENCALEILSIDNKLLCNSTDNYKNSPLFLAVKNGHNQVALQILRSGHSYSIRGNDENTALHFMPNCSDEVCRLLVENNKNQINVKNQDGQTILHTWVEMEKIEIFKRVVTHKDIDVEIKNHLIELISQRDRFANNPFHIAVRKEYKEASVILANVYRDYKGAPTTTMTMTTATPGPESEPVLPWLVANSSSETPLDLALKDDREALEWLRLTFKDKKRYQEYEPVFLAVKNQKDQVAKQIWDVYIQYGWIHLYPGGKKIWEAALQQYSVTFANCHMGYCLQELRRILNQNQNELCRRNGLVPGLMKFFLQKTNLYEVRNTLSVVAALLATITFTAGFTVPGGFNNDTGEALLAHKAAFIVFVISDAFAMCCSMLMLACLVWSMVCDNIKSLILIDHCMPILMMALGSTLVAFMTGVYTVLRQKCLWVAIIIIVMCSIVIFSAKKAIMNVLLCIFNPVKYKKYRDLEQGKEDTSQDGHSSVRGCGSPHQRNE